MGRIKSKAQIPLSVFYLQYFSCIFGLMCLLAAAVLILFNAIMNEQIVYPANYAQKQVQSAYSKLQSTTQITEDFIPELCDYVVFDSDGNRIGGTLADHAAQNAWTAVQEGTESIGNTRIR